MPEATEPLILTRGAAPPGNWDGTVLLMDKPGGWTSFDVIRRLRRLLGFKKIGHAGTLDPMATGLLICLLGRPATRLQDRFMGLPKSYAGTLRLGETTPSYDADSEVSERRSAEHLTDDDLERARRAFEGELLQRPPMYSAVKVGGERLYKKARRGESVEREARPVSVYRLALVERRGADVDFEVE
ncbi:MAG: tRNA pseudouridine(55) synthase TruB, partial [Rhodothermales bacterium]|nr:tRNA pseudouridine(55) synthase TruB [Rhodothermales bacterium]